MLKKRKAEEQRASKKKANKKDFGAPKRPPTAYLLFMSVLIWILLVIGLDFFFKVSFSLIFPLLLLILSLSV